MTIPQEKAMKILLHAKHYCQFGLNPDSTIRTPEPFDLDAVTILNGLYLILKEDLQRSLIKDLADIIITTVKESRHGVPGGYVYAALMHVGCSFEQYEGIMEGLVKAGQIKKRGDCYYPVIT